MTFFLFALLLFPQIAVQVQRPPQKGATTSDQQPGVQPTVKPATVRGKVIASDTGAPLRRASISLRKNGGGGDVYSATTDAGGLYEIHNLDPGTYMGTATKSGYVTSGFKQGRTEYAPIVLAEDQELKDVNFLLVKAAVISGTVVDEHDEPIPNIQVSAMMKNYSQGRLQLNPHGSSETDDRGRFRIFDVPAGRYYIRAGSRNYNNMVDAHYASVLFPNATRIADAQVVNVAPGEEVTAIRFQMHEAKVFNVSGRVMDIRTGLAAAGANINVNLDESLGLNTGTQVKADGTFKLTELPPGHYRAYINIRDPNANRGQQTIRTFDVVDRDITGLAFVVGPGITLKGRVVADGGALPEKLRIQTLMMSDGRQIGGNMVDSAADGTFQMENVQPGEYQINVYPTIAPMVGAGRMNITSFPYVSRIMQGGQDLGDSNFVVSEEGGAADLTVTIAFDAGIVSGTVLDIDGKPFAANIAMVSSDPKKRAGLRYYRRGRSRDTGEFTIPAVIPGDYLLIIWPGEDPGVLMDPDVLTAVEKHGVRVHVSPSGTVNQELRLTTELQNLARTLTAQ